MLRTVAGVYDLILARVTAALYETGETWRLSAFSADDMVSIPDGADRFHLSWSLSLDETTPAPGRQLPDEPWLHTTSIRVRWLYRVRPEVRATDYRAALVAEGAIVGALVGTAGLVVALAGPITRDELTAPRAAILGEIGATCLHSFAPGGV